MVSKVRTHSRFSFSVRMNRSAQPLPFWCPDEGGRTLDAEKGQFLLEVIGHVLRAVIVAHYQTAGNCLGEPAEVLPYALPDWLQGLEAGGLRMRVNADAFGGAVIDR